MLNNLANDLINEQLNIRRDVLSSIRYFFNHKFHNFIINNLLKQFQFNVGHTWYIENLPV